MMTTFKKLFGRVHTYILATDAEVENEVINFVEKHAIDKTIKIHYSEKDMVSFIEFRSEEPLEYIEIELDLEQCFGNGDWNIFRGDELMGVFKR